MKKLIKYVVIIGVVVGVCGAIYGFYLAKQPWWNDMWKKKGGSFSAVQIVKDFNANEDSATMKYPSNKAIDVEGVVKDVKLVDGKTSIWLNANDSAVNVNFVMREVNNTIKTGDNVILRGTCTGKLDDVLFNDGVVIK